MSVKKSFLTGWMFFKSSDSRSICELNDPQITWQPVDLPHDWLISQVDDLYESAEGWYQNTLNYQPSDQLISICFDGVYMNSTIYVNDQEAGSWKYGYSSFEFELTPYLIPGHNRITVRVRHQAPNSRWYSGAGIYRNVWLRTSTRNHFQPNGIYISTQKITDQQWQVTVLSEVCCEGEYTISHQLFDPDGNLLAETGGNQFLVSAPRLWDLSAPDRYRIRSRLSIDGLVADEETNAFGFRSIRLDPDSGFYFNEQPLKLKGVCNHHDLGGLGAAFHIDAARRQLLLIKEMGANALRTAHNMPAPELLELADELGLLVVNEAFDMWERPKTEYDYARFFPEYSTRDVESWVKRDRNHPCVILWSIGNEIYDTHAGSRGQEITRELMSEVQRHDPLQNAAVTIGSNYMPWENAQNCADIVKIAGYNYSEKLYQEHHEKHPDWIIYGSETASVVQSRGIYHFPLNQAILSDDDCQCSSLGNSTTSWGAKSLEFCALTERDTPYSLGQFIWSGFDYIGEPTPYHTKNSYLGQIDTAGFPKDSFYFYQSVWTDYRTAPMVHLLPYWDFNIGQRIDVRAFSNAPWVELFLNGTSLGRQALEHQTGTKVIGDWQVPYEPGELRAVAYDEALNVIAVDTRHSFQDADCLALTADRTELQADGRDLAFLTVTALDPAGMPVENANNRITVEVTGPGRLLALDNGDSTDYEPYQCCSRRLFSGKLLIIAAAAITPGDFQITVRSPGLKPAVITLHSRPYHHEIQTDASFTCPPETVENHEIPIRKIELISPQGNSFSPEQTTISVKAVIYPANATYHDLEWRVTGTTGVDIKHAEITPVPGQPDQILLTAHGDGDFILRCTARNGKRCVDVISSLEYSISGLGVMFTDPYAFVSASLYASFTGELGTGNERGVATARDSMTTITFDQIDFGDYGSDTITLPIFELDGAPTSITFREGTEPLGTFIYHKPSRWNVYQEETFQFNRRLKGITGFTIELNHKVHIKGFCFKKYQKAYETLDAASANAIYGDSFQLEDQAVTGIGNNVSLLYHDMDFGTDGFTKLRICGRCPIDKNTIHIRFHGESEDNNQIAEFTHTEDYEVQEFTLPPVYGAQTVTFVFLPGSHFDFRWFCFEK